MLPGSLHELWHGYSRHATLHQCLRGLSCILTHRLFELRQHRRCMSGMEREPSLVMRYSTHAICRNFSNNRKEKVADCSLVEHLVAQQICSFAGVVSASRLSFVEAQLWQI